ncbi:MAG TPA: DUF4388 domain-containing protein [Polyangia bacterium]|jgi:DNA-binding response OmpR family regulator/Flp pilus assembly protein TadD|nr:DUF4388 domain-containing protein [Polyangia bacterium]
MAGYVLIVERDPDLQRKIGEALRDAGYEHGSEADVAWAHRSIAGRAPDAVIVGELPADGAAFRFAEELRRAPDSRRTPIVFVSGRARGASHRAEARRRYSPAACLEGALDPAELLAALATLIAPLLPPPPLLVQSPAPPVAGDPEQQRERRDVERRAKRLDASAELRGTLRRTSFAHLLQKLYAQRASGSLLLRRQETKKIVGFQGGYLLSVRSNVLAECLGQILVSQKLITEQALASSVARMQREKRRQGEILVELGALSPYNLQRALVEQIEAKLFEIFSWRDGNFMFKEGTLPADGSRPLERSPAALILEGVRRFYDSARQDAVLASLDNHPLRLSPDPVLRLQEMTSDSSELGFIRSINGSARLPAILGNAALSREKARSLIVALHEAGMIEVVEGPPARRRSLASSAGHPVTSRSGSPPPVVARPVSSGGGPYEGVQLSLVAMALRTQSPFWALGVEPDASPGDVDRAYETLARRFHADRYRHAGADDRRTAREIFNRLGEAYSILRDPNRQRPPAAKADESAEPRAPSARRKSSDSSGTSSVSGSFATGDSLSTTAVRAIYDAGIDHLRSRRHHEAVEAFRQAARLSPGQADFRAALGWALFREAPADARAGRAALAELRRALQIDGRNRQAMQYLAQIYEQTAQPDLAIKELEKILALDPSANEAADELRRLRDER